MNTSTEAHGLELWVDLAYQPSLQQGPTLVCVRNICRTGRQYIASHLWTNVVTQSHTVTNTSHVPFGLK